MRVEREEDRSVEANFSQARRDIGTPGRGEQMEDKVGIEDRPSRASDLRISSPELNPSTKRDLEDEDDTKGVLAHTARGTPQLRSSVMSINTARPAR